MKIITTKTVAVVPAVAPVDGISGAVVTAVARRQSWLSVPWRGLKMEEAGEVE